MGSRSSAAMVPAQVVLSGGAGMTAAMQAACEQVYAQFDPPIKTGKYSKLDILKGQQREHGVANSAMQSERGSSASNVPDALAKNCGGKGYTEGGGFCFNVWDGQSEGAEHKWLTDAAKEFHEKLSSEGTGGTLKEHLDQSEKNWEQSFKEKLRRRKGQAPRSRIKDADKKSKKEIDDLAKAAAKCLRMEAEKAFAEQNVPLSAKCRAGLAAAVKKAAKIGRAGGGAA